MPKQIFSAKRVMKETAIYTLGLLWSQLLVDQKVIFIKGALMQCYACLQIVYYPLMFTECNL